MKTPASPRLWPPGLIWGIIPSAYMTVQLFGTKKSNGTKKVERFLKERRIEFQFIDVASKAPALKELDALAHAAGGYGNLIDKDARSYRKRGMQYMEFDPREELLEDPSLLRIPAIRCDRGAAVDPDPETLKRLLEH